MVTVESDKNPSCVSDVSPLLHGNIPPQAAVYEFTPSHYEWLPRSPPAPARLDYGTSREFAPLPDRVISASNETTAAARFSVAFMKFVRLHNKRTQRHKLRYYKRARPANTKSRLRGSKLRNLFGKFDTADSCKGGARCHWYTWP